MRYTATISTLCNNAPILCADAGALPRSEIIFGSAGFPPGGFVGSLSSLKVPSRVAQVTGKARNVSGTEIDDPVYTGNTTINPGANLDGAPCNLISISL